MSNEMDNPVQSYMPVKLMSFKSESSDEVCCNTGLLELTDSGNGFVEVGFDYATAKWSGTSTPPKPQIISSTRSWDREQAHCGTNSRTRKDVG